MNDIICYNTIGVHDGGIIIEHRNINIRFDDCVKNYIAEKGIGTSNCIATRDITTLSFTFFTQPKIRIIFKKSFLKRIVLRRSAISNFINLQNAIVQSGYTTYDLS